jgi:ribosomal protein L22
VAAATDTPTVRAQAKWVRTSARKARLVAEHVRGRSVPEARAVLAFTPRAAARDIEKVLASAVANAESRPDLGWDGDTLYVSSITVDEGPTLKRWRARARGRVARIKKRTCHITVTLAPVELPVEAPSRRGAKAGAAPAPAAAPEAQATESVAEPATEETQAEKKPRTRRAATPEADAAPEADATKSEAGDDKPKRRSRTKKSEEAS